MPKRARQTVADHQHDHRADDRQHDLRLDDHDLARALAAAPRPERQRRAQHRGEREPDEQHLELRWRAAVGERVPDRFAAG